MDNPCNHGSAKTQTADRADYTDHADHVEHTLYAGEF